jgi:hypothetical protein
MVMLEHLDRTMPMASISLLSALRFLSIQQSPKATQQRAPIRMGQESHGKSDMGANSYRLRHIGLPQRDPLRRS